MVFFWWTGRGYYTLLVVLATMTVCALALNVLHINDIEGRAFWGIVIALSAIPNWFLGIWMNATKRASIRGERLSDKLLYRARHGFLSLPMESFSVVIVVVGIAIAAADLL